MKANRKDSKRQNKALVGRGKSTPVRTAKKSVLIRDGAALEYSEGRLQAIFEQSPLSIQIFSADGDVLGANRAWEELWVSHREQLKGYNVLEDPQVKARGLLPYFERALSGETVFLPPAYYDPAEIGQKGRARWTRAVIYPVIDASGQVREIVVIHEDVTERYEAEQSTLLSEQRFRSLFENSPVSIWEEDFSELKSYLDELTKTGITDLDAYLTAHPEVIIKCIELVKIVDVNRAGMKLYEAGSKADLLGGLHKTFPPDSRLGFKAEILRIARGELRYESEGKAQTLQGNVRDVLVHWVVAPGHERTYSKVLVSLTDITELKQAEEKLRTAEAKYRTLIEKISPIVYTAEPEQHIGVTYISPQIEQLGFSQEEWSADPDLWLKQLHPDDQERILAQLDELNGSVDPFQGEYRLITRDGQVRWFYDHAFPVKDAEGRTLFRQGYMLDITERKQAETHIRQYADIVGNMQIGLYVFHLEDREDDRSFKLVSANPAALEFSGVMAEEVVGKTLDEGFPDLRAMGIPQKYVDVIRTQMAVEIETSYYDDKQQLDTVFAVKAFPLPNEHVGVAFENITERKRAEELLQNSERRFRALIENSSEEVSLLSADGRLLYESPSANPTLGYAPGEFLGHSLFQIVHSEDLERVQVLFTDLIQMPGSSVRAQFRLRHKSGEWRWVEAVGTNLLDEPAVQAIVVNYHDITERKQVEDALQKSEERYRTLFEDSPISIWEEDFSKVKEYFDELRSRGVTDFREYFEGHREAVIECLRRVQVVDVNHTTLDLMQVRDKSELLTALSDSLSEDAIPTVAAELISLAEGNLSYESDEVFTTRRGEKRQVYFRLTVAPGYEETLGKVFVSIVDITDRKRAETDLINSYSLLNATLESTADGILVVDASGKVTSFNSKFLELWRIPIELADQRDDQVLINYVLDQLDDPASFITKVQELYSSSAQTSIDELKFRDGRIFERYSQAQILDDKIVGRVWSFRDVTERKQGMEALRQSEERYRTVVENQNEFIVRWKPDGVRTFVNEAYCRYFGLTSEQALSSGFMPLIHEDDRRMVEEKISRLLSGESGVETDTHRVVKGDGTIGWQEWTDQALYDDKGQLVEFQSVGRDVTERRHAEDQLRQSEARYHALFEDSPVSIWEEDFSELKKRLELLKAQGITDLRTYFSTHPSAIDEYSSLIRILDVNKAAIRMYGAESKEQLIDSSMQVLSKGERENSINDFIAIAEGRTSNYWEGGDETLSGDYIEISLGWSVLPGHEGDYSKVIVTVIDITERKKAQSELQASEERFRLLASNIREVFWITDPVAQKVVYLSPAYEEVWGRRLEDQLQNTDLFLETVLPEDAQRVRATIERQRRGEKTEMEYRIRRPDGSIRWIWDRAFPFVDESRKVKLITGIAADITERKKAEVETLRHLDELQALYENGLAVGRLLTSREIGERVIQTFTQYLLWHHVTIRLRKGETDDLELIAFSVPDMKEEDKEGTAQNFTTRISKVGQGMSGWVVQTGVPIRTGNVHEYPQYVDTYEGIRSGMYMPLQVGDQIIGSISVESELPDAFTLQDERLLATLSTQAAVAFENARLYQAVQQELSERRRAEAMLEQERNSLAQRVEERTSELIAANTNLARALRVKDEFLANMSHELRTPLNAILGLSESLGEQVAGPLNEKQQKYVQTITESGHHLLALINDILDLAKIDAGQVTLDFSKVDVHSLCQSSLRMVKQMAQKKNQEVMLEIDDEIGLIWADERRLKQMIVNLLSNAVKFTQEGGKLGLEVRGDKEENRVLISVWDHGIGIADDDIAKLFQPFVQLSTGLARESTGTGLGLALVAQMARLHGGGVSVSSIPGEGSRFTLVLPWEPALAVDTVERMKVTGKFRAVRNIGEHERRKILLIEDTPDVVMMVRDYLEASGYNVAVAEDGLEGIAQAKRVHPDLILMDLQMPRMDGFEATKKLRLDPDFRTTPIIALTALAMQGDRERCLAAGMDEYITKPVNLKGLVKIIEACLTIPQEKKPESQ